MFYQIKPTCKNIEAWDVFDEIVENTFLWKCIQIVYFDARSWLQISTGVKNATFNNQSNLKLVRSKKLLITILGRLESAEMCQDCMWTRRQSRTSWCPPASVLTCSTASPSSLATSSNRAELLAKYLIVISRIITHRWLTLI